MCTSVGKFTHPRIERTMMRRAPSIGRSNLGQFGPRVDAFGESGRAALQRLARPASDACPTFRRLAVPVEGMVRIERPDMDPPASGKNLRRASCPFSCMEKVGSASGERQRRLGWSPQQERAAHPSRESGIARQFSGHAMRHILEKQRRHLRLVTDHRADAVIGRGKVRFGSEARKRPILGARAMRANEQFARCRKIAGFSHHAPDGGRCGARFAPKRMGLHVRGR